jgi:signal transduction histidine kinase
MLRLAVARSKKVKSRINAAESAELGPLSSVVRLTLSGVHRIPAFVSDSVVTAIAIASMVWGAAASQSGDETHWRWWVWVLAVVVCLPLQWRRRAPFAVWLTVGTLIIVYSFLNASAANWNHCDEFDLLVAMTTVAYLGTRLQFVTALTLSITGTFVVMLGPQQAADATSGSFVKSLISLLVTLLAFIAGRLGAKQREYASMMAERANQVEQTAAAQASEAAAAERTRIARDMHDIVAHAVSLMVVQAEAGATVVHNSPDRAERAFDSIADTGREALTQLRRVLGVLRDGDALALALAPQPTIAALPALIGSVRGTGLEVALYAEGESRHLHTDTEVAVYRTVQEALTNTVKHAQASRAEVRLAWGWNTLTVTIADNGRGLRWEEVKRAGGANDVRAGAGARTGAGVRVGGGDVGAQRAAGTTGAIGADSMDRMDSTVSTDSTAVSAVSVSVGDTLLAAVPAPGRGLIGINERIGACGGTVATGPGLDGRGFSISAVVPVQSAPAPIAEPRGPEGHDEPVR